MASGRRGWARGALAGGALGLVCALGGSLWSCSLILDFSARSDAGPDDAAAGDSSQACSALEPNDRLTLDDSMPIDPGTYALAICPAGDQDYFRFTLAGQQDVKIEIRFQSSAGTDGGDLELRLYDESMVIDRSTGFGDTETIERSQALANQLPAGTYFIEVYGFSNAVQNNYTLELTVTDQTPDAGLSDAGPPDA